MQCASAILSPVDCQAPQYFSTLSHKRNDFREKKILHIKGVLIFSTNFVWSISHNEKNQRDITTHVHRSTCKIPVIIIRLYWNLNFLDRFSTKKIKYQISWKSVQWEPNFFHVGGPRDRRTYMMMLIVAFRNFANAPKTKHRTSVRVCL